MDLRWEDQVPVTPRKQANKQGGPTPPSSLMSPGEGPASSPSLPLPCLRDPRQAAFSRLLCPHQREGGTGPGLTQSPPLTFALDLKLPPSRPQPHSIASRGLLRLQPPS